MNFENKDETPWYIWLPVTCAFVFVIEWMMVQGI